MQVMEEDHLTIDARSSFDPDDPTPDAPQYPFGNFYYYFDCFNVTTDGETVEPFPYTQCFDDVEGLMYTSPDAGFIQLPNGTLAPGRYMFEVSVYKEPFFAPLTREPLNRQVVRTKRVEVLDTKAYYLQGELKLDLEYNTTLAVNPTAFIAAVEADLRAVTGLAPSRLEIVGHREGSVVLDFRISPPGFEDVNGATLDEVEYSINFNGLAFHWPTLEEMFQLSRTIAVLNLPVLVERYTASSEYQREVLGLAADAKLVLPVVMIRSLGSAVINANEKLVIETELRDAELYANQTLYYWSVVRGQLDLDDYPKSIAMPRNSSNLVIKHDVLTPGQEYELRVTVENAVSRLTAYASVSFVANGAPSSGTCRLFPETGFAGQTEFTVSCQAWEDDDSDDAVEYEFRYYDPMTQENVPLVARSRTNEVKMILPPVTLAPQFELTLALFIVDAYNAKAHLNKTVVLLPPAIDDEELYVVDCFESNYTIPQYCGGCYGGSDSDSVNVLFGSGAAGPGLDSDGNALGCVGNYNLTGASAFTQQLVETRLRTATGTNNVPLLLTLGTTIAKINNLQAEARAAQIVPDTPIGSVPSAAMVAQEQANALNQAASDSHMRAVMKALKSAVESSRVSKEELDQFGAVFRESSASVEGLRTGDNAATAQTSVLELAQSSTGTGIAAVASQGLLDTAGMLVEAADGMARDSMTDTMLEQGAAPTESAAAMEEAQAEFLKWSSEQTEGILSAMAMAGVASNVPGEDPYAVSSPNLQLQSEVKQDPAGDYTPPPEPGKDPAMSPSFAIPPGVGQQPDGGRVDVVMSTHNKNPYSFVHNTTSRIQGNVASFSLKPHGSQEEETVEDLVVPVQIKIPMSVKGSVCRRQTGGCRYWDAALGDWSTEGMFERERTADYILCEAIHLSTFAVSADDVVPEFNLPDPSADLFASINLTNSLAIFVVGFILFGFSVANFVGYKKDVRDRHKKRLAEKLSTVDARLSQSKGLALGGAAGGVDNGGGRVGAPLRAPGAAAGGALTAAQRADADARKKTLGEMMGDALKKGHNLLSILTVEPGDDFTRPQRLAVLLNIVLGQIAVAAVFFGMESKNIGAKVLIGVVTAVVLAPSKFAFKLLFKKSTYRKPPVRTNNRSLARQRKREQKAANAQRKAAAAKAAMAAAEASTSPEETLKPHVKPAFDPIAAAARRGEFSPANSRASTPLDGAAPPPPPTPPPPPGGLATRPQRRQSMRLAAAQLSSFVPPPPAPPTDGRMRPRRRPGSRSVTPVSDPGFAGTLRENYASEFVPPPPGSDGSVATGAPGRPRRNRSVGSAGSSGSSILSGMSGTMPPPPPPPLPGDAPMRPQRRSNPSSRASTPMSDMSVTHNPMAQPAGGGHTVHDNPLAMALPPAPAPPGPGEALRPQRSRARAAMMAAVGGPLATSQFTPPPPPSDALGGGPSRPGRHRRGGPGMVSGGGPPPPPGAPPSNTSADGRNLTVLADPGASWALVPSGVKQRGIRKTRPGFGRTLRPGRSPFASSTTSAATKLIEDRQAAYEGALTLDEESGAMVPRPESGDGEGGATGDLAYVPDAITFCVVRIQRAWRMYAAVSLNRRMKAVLALQKCWRGHVARRNLKETLKAQAKGRQVHGLWWVQAHMQRGSEAFGQGAAKPKAKPKEEEDGPKSKKSKAEFTDLKRMATGLSTVADDGELGGEAVLQRWTAKQINSLSRASAYDVLQAAAKEQRDQIRRNKEAMKAERRRKLRERKRRGNRGLPRWCIYIAYFFSFVNCMFCSFCIMYVSFTLALSLPIRDLPC